MSKKTGVVKDLRYLRHGDGWAHPESPERLVAIYEMIDNPDMAWKFNGIDARHATHGELERVHRPAYVDFIARTAGKSTTMLDYDTTAGADTYDTALLAAGGFMNAIDSVVSKETDNAFALVRPPGHHAQAATAAGFCIFNNIAVGARHAMARWGLQRIMIVDWDLHHGNGSQEIFYSDREVLFFSMHQSPAYPGTGSFGEIGEGPGLGYTINLPLRPGAEDALYIRLFRELLSPIVRSFRPELILVSAGFDPYIGDPLGEMKVTPEGFASLTRILLDLAEGCCEGRLAMVLEGGYNVQGLAKCVRAVLLEMIGETRVTEETLGRLAAGAGGEADRVIGQARQSVGPFWPVF